MSVAVVLINLCLGINGTLKYSCKIMSSRIKVDYLLNSEIVQTLKVAQDKKDFKCVECLLKDLTKENPDAVIELSNDDWLKDPSVQLPPAVLVGESYNEILFKAKKVNVQYIEYLILNMMHYF